MKYRITFFLLIILVTSCKKELNDIPDTGRKIVINGLITNDSIFSIRIGSSAYILDISGTSYKIQNDLKDAVVKVFQNRPILIRSPTVMMISLIILTYGMCLFQGTIAPEKFFLK